MRTNRLCRHWPGGMLLLVVAGGLIGWMVKRPEPEAALPIATDGEARRTATVSQWQAMIDAQFAGDQACRQCHAEQFKAHQRSGHSHTASLMVLTELAGKLEGSSYRDPVSDREFRFALREKEFLVIAGEGPDERRLSVDWLLGSGHRAQTAVSILPGGRGGIEHRWTFLAQQEKLGVTPSHENLPAPPTGDIDCFGRPMDRKELLNCLGCHMTFGPPPGAPIRSDLFVPNSWCERCHGPRKQHVEAARRGTAETVAPLVNLRDPQVAFGLCAQCHRSSDHVDDSVPEHESVRFQPYRLELSRCWQEAKGGLSCATCHDPHDRLSRERTAYRAACLDCHTPPEQVPCPVEPQGACITCHMPQIEWTSGIRVYDHWIRVLEKPRQSP